MRPSSVPTDDCCSEQVVFPSAALGLIENPFGKVIVLALSADGDGVFGSWNCGTLSTTSTPEAVSVSVVVGFAARLGSKLERVAPGGRRPAACGVGPLEVVGERFDRRASGPTQVVGFWFIGAIGSEEGTSRPAEAVGTLEFERLPRRVRTTL